MSKRPPQAAIEEADLASASSDRVVSCGAFARFVCLQGL